MFETLLFFSTLEDVKKFVDFALSKECEMELISGKYVINAKSIMGVFSLDLTEPIKLVAHCGEDLTENLTEFLYHEEI